MAQDSYLDGALALLFALGATTTLGISDVTLANTQLSTVWMTFQGVDITYATLMSIGSIAGVWIVNGVPTIDMLDMEQRVLIGLTVILVFGAPFIPQFRNVYTDSAVLAIAAFTLEAGGYYSLALENEG